MINKLKINNVDFGFGLVWEDLDSNKTKAQIISILDENACKFGVHKKNTSEQQLGYTNDKDLKGALSAAYVLSCIEENITIIEQLDDDNFWVCGVNEGKVISTTDIIVSRSELAQCISDLIGTYTDIELEVELTCSELVAEVLTELDLGLNIVELQSLEDKLQSFDLKKQVQKQARIISQKGVPVLGVALGLVILGAGAVAFSLTSQTNEYVEMENEWVTPEPSRPTLHIKSQEEIIAEIKAQAYAEEVRWLTEDFINNDPVAVINSFIDLQKRIPMFIGGWEVEKIDYERAKGNFLSVHLNRGAIGTPVTLKDSLKTYRGVVITDGGNKAIVTFNMHDIKRHNKIDNVVTFIAESYYKDNEVIHDAHFMGYKWSVINKDLSQRRTPIAGIPNKDEAALALLKNEARQIRINGSRPYKLANVIQILDKAETTLVDQLTMNRSAGNEWDLILVTYTK